MFKRVFTYLIFAFLFIVPSFVLLRAQAGSSSQEDPVQTFVKNSAQPNQESWLLNSTVSNLATGICGLSGCPEQSQLVEQLKTSSYIPGGAIGVASQTVAMTFSQPISGIQYLAKMKDNLLGKSAYAQGAGYGFNSITGLLPIWRAFRNLVYLASSLLFIMLGLMIILRVKLNPQTVVSIQSAIPDIITTLLLVTFSYAIAGLLLDLMKFVEAAGVSLLFSATGKTIGSNLFDDNFIYARIFGLQNFKFSDLVGNNLGKITNLSTNLIPWQIITILGSLIGGMVGGIFGSAGGLPIGLAGGAIGAILGPMIIHFILLLLVLYFVLKLLIGLIKIYVSIIFKIIIGPLEIGLGAIPGIKAGFSSWLKDLFAMTMTFPIITLFLVIANMLVESTLKGWGQVQAPAIIDATGMLTGGGIINALPFFIGFSALMMVAQLPELIPQAIFALKPSPWETAIGKGKQMVPGYGAAKGVATGLSKKATDGTVAAISGTLSGAIARKFPNFFGP